MFYLTTKIVYLLHSPLSIYLKAQGLEISTRPERSCFFNILYKYVCERTVGEEGCQYMSGLPTQDGNSIDKLWERDVQRYKLSKVMNQLAQFLELRYFGASLYSATPLLENHHIRAALYLLIVLVHTHFGWTQRYVILEQRYLWAELYLRAK